MWLISENNCYHLVHIDIDKGIQSVPMIENAKYTGAFLFQITSC